MSTEIGAGDGPCNADRAEWAEHALSAFCDVTGLNQQVERSAAVSDLLCDLGHYCDLHELNFLAVAAGAIGVWDAERREELSGEANALYREKKVLISLFNDQS